MQQSSRLAGHAVYVVDGCRTPFLKSKGVGPFSASDLAVAAGTALLNRQPFAKQSIDEVILGCAMPGPDEANIARLVALRLGCGDHVPAYTVMRNCASGMQSIDDASMLIALGRRNLVLAGGTEAMSRAPVLFNSAMVSWLSKWLAAKKPYQRLKLLSQLRPGFLTPVLGLVHGLSDPFIGMNMGQTAENLAYKFNLTRTAMDQFAYNSHQRAHQAYAAGNMDEVIPIIDKNGRLYTEDDGIRADSSIEKLAKLAPIFDRTYGMVTAGNSSQVSDGACMLLLASSSAVEEHKLPVLGRIVDCQWDGLAPQNMGLGPAHAISELLKRNKLKTKQVDCWEINEAFAAQVLACCAALDDTDYAQQVLGLEQACGSPEMDLINTDGGAIALGHPIGASGARIVLHTLKRLEKIHGERGIASICIGGGQGGAMYLERTTQVNQP